MNAEAQFNLLKVEVFEKRWNEPLFVRLRTWADAIIFNGKTPEAADHDIVTADTDENDDITRQLAELSVVMRLDPSSAATISQQPPLSVASFSPAPAHSHTSEHVGHSPGQDTATWGSEAAPPASVHSSSSASRRVTASLPASTSVSSLSARSTASSVRRRPAASIAAPEATPFDADTELSDGIIQLDIDASESDDDGIPLVLPSRSVLTPPAIRSIAPLDTASIVAPQVTQIVDAPLTGPGAIRAADLPAAPVANQSPANQSVKQPPKPRKKGTTAATKARGNAAGEDNGTSGPRRSTRSRTTNTTT